MTQGVSITKKDLANKYGINTYVLGNFMNHLYFEELSKLGYNPEMKYLPPIIVRKFIELYGEPIKTDEL
jgi:hypothetical protein